MHPISRVDFINLLYKTSRFLILEDVIVGFKEIGCVSKVTEHGYCALVQLEGSGGTSSFQGNFVV